MNVTNHIVRMSLFIFHQTIAGGSLIIIVVDVNLLSIIVGVCMYMYV